MRHTHPDLRLHVVGSRGPRRYTRRILRRIAEHADWIELHLDLTRDEVNRLVASTRYGLHAMIDEHFGMAPAEMAAGGCIVWVQDSGGPLEIVNGDSRLTFESLEDAVPKILRVMADPVEQRALRAVLAGGTERFALEGFKNAIRQAVDELCPRPDERIKGAAGILSGLWPETASDDGLRRSSSGRETLSGGGGIEVVQENNGVGGSWQLARR